MQLVNVDFNSHSVTSLNSVILGNKKHPVSPKDEDTFPIVFSFLGQKSFPSPECHHPSCKKQIAFSV